MTIAERTAPTFEAFADLYEQKRQLEAQLRGIKAAIELRAARMAAGLSQSAMAQKLGISQAALCHIENGNRLPGRDLAVRIETELGIEVASWSSAA